MANSVTISTQSKGARMAAQRLALRNTLWPEVPEWCLWNRKREAGFVTVPRTLSIIIQIQNDLTKNTPMGSTYLDLWLRVYDEGFVKLEKPHEMALSSGFTTDRGPSIWASRLDLLVQHKFIALAPGPQGNRSFALIFNPYWVIQEKRHEINQRLYNTLMGQALAIGAQVTAAPPAPPPPPPPPPPPLAPQAHILAGAEDPPLPPPPDPGSDGPSVLGDAPVSGVVRRRRSISMEGSKR